MADLVAVTLIRHGKTAYNLEKKYLGWTDAPLLNEEKARLRALRRHYPSPDLVITSDLKRCAETAERLFPAQDIVIDPRFRECHFGDFEGKSYRQLEDHHDYRMWLENPFQTRPPNGEFYRDFQARLTDGWKHMVNLVNDQYASTVTIVTHAGVIRHFLVKYSCERNSFWQWDIGFGCGYTLFFEREQLGRDGRCISLREAPSTEKPAG